MADNLVQAGVLKVGLSNYVATAALAVLAGAVALFSFVQQNYNPTTSFYVVFILAIGALVLSIIVGGRGAAGIVNGIAAGTWNNSRTGIFNAQAILTLAGLCLVLGATWLGTTSPEHRTADPCIAVLSTDLAASNLDDQQLRHDLAMCKH
jgi:amino acid transporter